MDLDLIRAAFFEECAELLQDLETHLNDLAQGNARKDAIHAAFRAAHSIKGGGAAFQFDALVQFAHIFESALDMVRSGKRNPDADFWNLALRATDHLGDLVQAAQSGTGSDVGDGTDLMEGLRRFADGLGISSAPAKISPAFPPAASNPISAAPAGSNGSASRAAEPPIWLVRFLPARDLPQTGNDPAWIFRELAQLGSVQAETDFSDVPRLADMDPTQTHLRFSLFVHADTSAEIIAESFQFVEADGELSIGLADAGDGSSDFALDAGFDAPETEHSAAPDAQANGLSLAALLDELTQNPAPSANADTDLPAPKAVALPPGAPKIDKASERPRNETARAAVRVDTERLDRISVIADEVAIACAAVSEHVSGPDRRRDPELQRALDGLAGHVRALQDAALALRAAPVKTIFQRMNRVVREAADHLGKKVRLETAGDDVEIDKTLVDAIADPLTHLLRNAVDHGIELPEARLKMGKSEEGRVRMSAEQTGGRIIIRVEDDGFGLNRAKILDRARERGIVSAQESLSDEAIDDLIFAPGFSTADKVTNLSGRGVGLDVVRDNVLRVGGRVSIRSVPGQGSCFTLSFPLTLAVIDAMLVRIGSETYAMPISEISETLRVSELTTTALANGTPIAQHRGKLAPLIDAHLCLSGREAAQPAGLAVMCSLDDGGRVGLLIDDVIGQSQVAVKGLEAHFTRVPGIAGGAILGDGRVALILDIRGLCDVYQSRRHLRLAG